MLCLCRRVVFKFKNSRKSNNGTDVNAGQIPQLLYRLPNQDGATVNRRTEQTEPAHVLSRDFSLTVTPVSHVLSRDFSLTVTPISHVLL